MVDMLIEGRTSGQSPMFPGSVRANGFIFTSGLVCGRALASAPGEPLLPVIVQIREALEELQRVLEASGSDLEHVVRIDSFITSLDDLPLWNEAFALTWPALGPVRTTLIVALPHPQVKFELTAIAVPAE